MQLKHGIQLGYCTNIHRGETWEETFAGLDQYTLRVRERVGSRAPYGIGLRLSAEAAAELDADRGKVDEFRRWLEDHDCYVFTINGFPYGKFHGTRVKEQVYAPDWSTSERLDYTKLLFDLICEIAPEGISASVSTLPGSFKEFITDDAAQGDAICRNVRACSAHIEQLREKTGRDLHLGMEPEPLGWFETSAETVSFFERLTGGSHDRDAILRHIGVNYDTCHLAVEYEEPAEAIGTLRNAGIRISKIHLSSALALAPTPESLEALGAFSEDTYLHQVIVRSGSEITQRFRDLPKAFAWANDRSPGDEWRVHFHVPVHTPPDTTYFRDTRDHITGTLDLLGAEPGWCDHFEIETYTWEVMPETFRAGDVVDQIEREYGWVLGEFERCGLR